MKRRLTLPMIQRAVWEMLRTDPGRRPQIAELAGEMRMSYRQFQKALSAIGKTGRQVRSWCCITYAQHLIGNGAKIEAAMMLSGYRNRTHFVERYREYLGCLPHESRGQKTHLLKAS